ncbi:MAG: M66 family metalloprotease [Acidobacteriota bacterium]|nr:M66 family metalloprotease [Acidobacteriota bacterium]
MTEADGQTRTASVTVRVARVVASQQDALTALYQSTGGPDWFDSRNWGTSRPLREWHGVTVDDDGRVTDLDLYRNGLTGPIPAELGNLTNLRELILPQNGLIGPLPPELGNLTSLRELNLGANGLTGPLPPELGNLTSLTTLGLEGNHLTGPLPPELGDLTSLAILRLEENDFKGPIPPELGDLTRLTELNLSGNSGLAGILPTELTGLDRLETLLAVRTDLCAPSDPGFQDWLVGIDRRRVASCVTDSPTFAYLVQAVQSREYPVPLVAGEKALLRVFVTARRPMTTGIPPVRAWFYVDGTEVHVTDIPAGTASVPTEVYEGDLSRSSNAEIPGEIIRPGLEMVVEIDPEGTLDPNLVTASRIPDTGRMAIDVREMPVLHLTVIPFLWSDDPHRGVVETAEAMEADPEGHELLWKTRTLLPIGDLEVTAHAPVMTSTSYDDFFSLFGQTEAIRAMEGGSGHYMGTMSRPGQVGPTGAADKPGWVFISTLYPATIAHELGHNLSLSHAPCGGAGGPDPAFPSPDGSTGAWGYDFRYGGALTTPGRPDVMSYCEPSGISDYHFANALRFRLLDEGLPQAASLIAQEAKSLLLWGGMDAEGRPFLNPSFVVDAPSALPRAPGEHRITGRSGSGDELFSVGFTMPEVADGDGSSSFAFVLPVEPGWAVRLASITLSGPGGSVRLHSDTNVPLYILVDPGTRQVRGILRDLPQAGVSALVSPAGADRLDVLFSRGIPDAAAWGQRRILHIKGIGRGQAPPPALMLSVTPSFIDWGEKATLTWDSTHAESVEITPDLGAVPAAGSRKVSPRTTTTYHITVRGAGGQTRTASATVTVVDSQQDALIQRDALTALYQSTGGPDWFDSTNWGTSRPLGEWYGITVDDDGRVTELHLRGNGLTGPLPAELGNLTSLSELNLGNNGFTGPLPPELGDLTSLEILNLKQNALTGPISPELGNLSSLTELGLKENELTGPIPPELGDLTLLTTLWLEGNHLTGPLPPEVGDLTSLTELNLSGNSGLVGILPTEMTGLDRLETLWIIGTDLCAPSDPGFQDWLVGIDRLRVATCVSESAAFAYLVQAVQSREYPVPLIAGEKALLRVFVTAMRSTTVAIPPVRARFYLDGTQIHVADVPARTASLPTEVYEGDLSRSSNAEIPGEIIRPGLEMVVEIDPEGTLDPGLVTASRIPDTGRMAVDVREMPTLHLTVIPFLWRDNPHRAAVEIAEAMEADPEGHELLHKTRTLLPIGDLEVTAHAPVMTSTSPDEFYSLLGETEAIRAMEGGSGHYMGTMSRPGRVGRAGEAKPSGRVFISRLNSFTIAHELGHNLSLYHAPCGGAAGPDPAFPYPDGSTGAWGYDFRYGGALATPFRPDLMSYCEPAGISDYHFTNALRFRLVDEGPPPAASLIAQDESPPRPASLIAQEATSLLLWGGMDAKGQLFLHPSFVIDAPAALPRTTGEHRITGRSESGDELFSVGFTMPEVADGDGRSSFAFVLPVEPGWAVRLASITLSGPGGSVRLDSDTDIPLYILVDPGTRQVRGILRDLPQAGVSALVSQAGAGSLDVLFSRGIPDAAAWGP